MGRWLVFGAFAVACGGPAAPSGPTTVVVPPAQGGSEPGKLPPRGPRAPPPAADPFDAYVGTWEGRVNDTISTELVVEHSGRFRVTAPATSFRGECDLSGRFRASERIVWMDVEKSSCAVVAVGSTLERSVLSKSEREFTVENEDGSLVIRYTRRQALR